ncbi:DUF2798 domain-containing protein [Ferrimonas marina]|uniref:DUF2798 domain-containing protein n=1 Tax=Ferrimonas marina TaxID=299255 RepID=A0A1M5Z5F9_9GAMM|nr:DUF2798 domain-containing protein [Ferrimonas marina]SHI19113.1 Protein of unknown function [Ferrimonas marina]
MSAQLALPVEGVEPHKTPLYLKVLVVAAMMSLMGGTLTGVMTYVNLGYNAQFFSAWGSAFLVTALVMMPAGAIAMTGLTKLAAVALPKAGENRRNALVGLCMAVVMESLMAFTTATRNVGFADTAAFTDAWRSGFIAALPVGLMLMMIISLTIKPKLEAFLKS